MTSLCYLEVSIYFFYNFVIDYFSPYIVVFDNFTFFNSYSFKLISCAISSYNFYLSVNNFLFFADRLSIVALFALTVATRSCFYLEYLSIMLSRVLILLLIFSSTGFSLLSLFRLSTILAYVHYAPSLTHLFVFSLKFLIDYYSLLKYLLSSMC